MNLDLHRVRAAFPALARGFVFLDNAGGSQTLGTVADRIRDYLLTTNVQLGASYEVSRLAGARVAAAAEGAARFLGATDAREAVLGTSTTQLLSNLALALGPSFASGDEVIVTDVDHEANRGPWRRLEERGVRVKEWRIDRSSLRLEAEGLAALLTPRTRLVAFTHVSNVLGSLHDVKALTALAHSARARVCVDGVAYAPHRALDVAAWGVDYYAFSFYKVFGPHMAVLYGRRALLEELPCLHHDFIGRDVVPYKLQPGNVCFELAHGLGGIFEYIDELGGKHDAFAAFAAHEESLAARLLGFLGSRRNVRVVGEAVADRSRRVATVSFVVPGRRSEEIVRAVDPHGIGIRFGDFYARRLVESLGLEAEGGVVRVSLAHYNTVEEVDRLVAVLEPALG